MYKKISGQSFTEHWAALYARFFEWWPERAIILPDLPANAPLDKAQKEVYNKAVCQRRKQIQW